VDVVRVAVETVNAQPETVEDRDAGDVELLPYLWRGVGFRLERSGV
jgi:hypothetical protein